MSTFIAELLTTNEGFSWRKIAVTSHKKGKLAGSISRVGKGLPVDKGTVTWKMMTR